MDLSSCQGNASSLEEKSIEQKDLSPRKTFQLDIESEGFFNFCARVIEFVKISIHCYPQNN